MRDTLDDFTGPGCADYESFRVKQRGAGANLSADIGNTALMRACIRGTTRDGQGFYFAENIDYTAPTTNTMLAQINTGLIFTTGDATNPRIDQVFLRILDQQHDGGASNLLQVQVVDGTPTGGATLDNRTGVGAVPANSILLADVLQPALSATITTANIRDRRQFPLAGVSPVVLTARDAVTFLPHPGAVAATQVITAATHDNMQVAGAMFLPRRVVGAVRIHWSFMQGATANAANYNLAICDASGRLIVATGATAFSGGANARSQAHVTIAATTFEPGWYYVWMGLAPMTASSTTTIWGMSSVVGGTAISPAVVSENIILRLTTGSTTFPATNTILGYGDVAALAGGTNTPPVPILTLGQA